MTDINYYIDKADIEILSEKEVKKPPMYKVIIHNDNYTTMDFVIKILINIFDKSFKKAVEIMLNIHNKGSGICGVYTYDIATTKIAMVKNLSEIEGFPLRSTMEKE